MYEVFGLGYEAGLDCLQEKGLSTCVSVLLCSQAMTALPSMFSFFSGTQSALVGQLEHFCVFAFIPEV